MSTLMMGLPLYGLRKVHLNQLQWYIKKMGECADFYGRKDYFDKRHKEIEQWIDDACSYVNLNDVVFPTKKEYKEKDMKLSAKTLLYHFFNDKSFLYQGKTIHVTNYYRTKISSNKIQTTFILSNGKEIVFTSKSDT